MVFCAACRSAAFSAPTEPWHCADGRAVAVPQGFPRMSTKGDVTNSKLRFGCVGWLVLVLIGLETSSNVLGADAQQT